MKKTVFLSISYNPRLWRLSLVSLEAENMINVPGNGQEGGQRQVGR